MSGAFSGRTIGDDSWGHTTREDVARNQENPVYVYFASKLLAEKSLWSYVQEEEHSNIDAITILPAFVYGPFAEHFPLPGHGALSSNNFIYELMNGTQPMVIPPAVVDVRDVAKAHVAALDLHRAPPGFVRRYIACSGNLTWGEAGDHLRQVRPDYQTLDNYVDLPGPALRLDTTRTVADLNLQWIDPRKTIVDAADALNEARKTWA
ncbi:hypothetical protein H0H93_016754 [Arthromyces matolae]|nr:hypothetical protein H0H93_016754 [Arthromyces matolae]